MKKTMVCSVIAICMGFFIQSAEAGRVECENNAIYRFGANRDEAVIMCAQGADAYKARVCVIESENHSFFEREEALRVCGSGKSFYESKICMDQALSYNFDREDALKICSGEKDAFSVKSCIANLLQAGVDQAKALQSCL